jgi:hypothetical protein
MSYLEWSTTAADNATAEADSGIVWAKALKFMAFRVTPSVIFIAA